MHANLVEDLRSTFSYLFDQGFVESPSKEDHRIRSVALMSEDFTIVFEELDGILDLFISHYYPTEKKHGRLHSLHTYVEFFEGHPVRFPENVVVDSDKLKLLSYVLLRYMNKLQIFN